MQLTHVLPSRICAHVQCVYCLSPNKLTKPCTAWIVFECRSFGDGVELLYASLYIRVGDAIAEANGVASYVVTLEGMQEVNRGDHAQLDAGK